MKRRLMIVLTLCCMLTAGLSNWPAAQAAEVLESGECGASGANVTWTLDDAGVLRISGHGKMKDYNNTVYPYDKCPWGNRAYSVIIENGVTGIGDQAFYHSSHLASLTIDRSVTSVGSASFAGCKSLTDVQLPPQLTSIGNQAFHGCIGLTVITLPESVRTIGSEAFCGCSYLSNVILLGEITSIQNNTFQGCATLREITLPDSVIVVGSGAFDGCNALSKVNYTGTAEQWKDITIHGDKNNTLKNAHIRFIDSDESTAVRLNAITVFSGDEQQLNEIPDDHFLAKLTVTELDSTEKPLIALCSYKADGTYIGLMYVSINAALGTTVEVMFPVDNSGGNIAQLKAFPVSSLTSYAPAGTAVSFPAA